MKQIIKWLNEALSGKDLVMGMTYYRVQNNEIRATDGRITACHPWPYDHEFLVAGNEFEKILARMPDEPTIEPIEGGIRLRSGRYHGTIHTLPVTEWQHPGVDEAKWKKIPTDLPYMLKVLRPFISDNAIQPWAMCVALQGGWVYATNNVAIAGAPSKGLDAIKALLPSWAIDFVLPRMEGLSKWAWEAHYVAFKWDNGAWMRSQLAIGEFPEKAAALVKDAWKQNPSQEITEHFREAFEQVVGLAEDTIEIHADFIKSKFGKAEIQGEAACEIPEGATHSIWGASFLAPALASATHWSPALWPKPVPFKGKTVAGYVVGRK